MPTGDNNATDRPTVELIPPGPQPVAPPSGEVPVPESPRHFCPNCDYRLAGILSRVCPECGEPFSLDDARRRAMDMDDTPMMRTLRLRDLVEAGAGLAAMAFAVTLWADVMGAAFGWIFWTIAQVMLAFFAALYAKLCLSVRWARSTLLAGLACLALVVTFRLAFGV